MANRFVRKSGSDANGGTGPSDAWLTFGKALGAAGAASGDTLYVGAGVYREILNVAIAPAATTTVIGDVDGALTGDMGEVRLTAYTTNDSTAPSASVLMTMNGHANLTFQQIVFQTGTGNCVDMSTTGSVNITFQDCTLLAGGQGAVLVNGSVAADANANWLFDRCAFFGGASHVQVSLATTATAADYDANITIQNCLMANGGSRGVGVLASGALANKGGGVRVVNCTITGHITAAMATTSANLSTSIPCSIYNSIIIVPSGVALNANTSGQILEDFNYLYSGSPRTNVTAGTSSKTSPTPALLLQVGQEFMQGKRLRPWLSPTSDSPLLGFGSHSPVPTVDFHNRPRPSGGASISAALGYLERHDAGVKETTTFDVTPAVKIAGPGDHDMLIAVNNTATTITIKAQYDTNHAATNKPQVILQTNGEIGVTTQTVTMTAAANTWETLTVGPFTPTAKGYVTLRLVSRSAAGNGNAFFDTATVPNLNTDGFDYFRRGEPFPALTQNAGGASGALLLNPSLEGM